MLARQATQIAKEYAQDLLGPNEYKTFLIDAVTGGRLAMKVRETAVT